MMESDLRPDEIDDIPHGAVLRLLTGPMRGCEFALPPGVTLFVIGPSDPAFDRGWQTEMPPNAIYVPMDGEGGDNFEVLVDDAGREGLFVRVLNEGAGAEVAIDASQIARIGDVRVGVKRVDAAWSDEVQRSLCAQARPDDEVSPARVRRRWQQAFWSCAVVVLLVASAFFYWRSEPQRQAQSVSEYLESLGGRATVLPGNDGHLYVLTEDGDARNALARALGAEVMKREKLLLVALDEENARITQWIDTSRTEVLYFKLSLDDPAVPELWINRKQKGLSDVEMAQFRQALLERIPYAHRVNVTLHDETEANGEAEDALKRQMVPFLRTDTPEGVTFHISTELDDVQLRRLYGFMQTFEKRWGKRLVHFNVDLRDDWTAKQSYAYGPAAYVKDGPHQWRFINRQ
ncbi:PrgH/EprH family type III secretion apparatus protein [Pandoraea oxalativorans]|uniref:Type III secretion system protein PrgH n=1 Tax=Pandoraea oxalativorans TaxID=573737 RepID=A0A0E3YAM3_9BURK|nr:PrgH/EprH family type III secretion apparatus protein [Pandoraea oxalativorans]AKC69007.1 hypothetical protein MB84_05300 [Pandoraea oxalativorans]